MGWLAANLLTPGRFLVLARDLQMPLPSEVPSPGIEAHAASAADLRSVRSHGRLPTEFFFDRIYGLSTCFLAFVRGQVACVEWLSLPGEFNRYFDLRPDEAEIFQSYVLPPYRSPVLGHAVARRARLARFRWLRERGYAVELARVAVSNRPLQRVLRAYGYRPIGQATPFAFHRARFRTSRSA
jgi:hypothetical protein